MWIEFLLLPEYHQCEQSLSEQELENDPDKFRVPCQCSSRRGRSGCGLAARAMQRLEGDGHDLHD